jgi:hypothetical protein
MKIVIRIVKDIGVVGAFSVGRENSPTEPSGRFHEFVGDPGR